MLYRAEFGIVGAGPAGARAAELLATLGARVVLLDPKAPWEKPCGGGLTPTAFDDIPELEELKSLARPVRSVRVEASREAGFSVPLERPLWILPRLELATWQLARALRAGAEHLPVKVSRVGRARGGWRIETSEGSITVPFLIGADGAASLVRRVAAPKFQVELAPTRVAYAERPGPTPDTAVLQFYKGLAGYLWDFPRPNHRSVGIGVPNGTWQRRRLDGEIDAYRASSEGCACPGLDRAGAVIGTAQLGHGDYSRIAGKDFALLGDAAGLADPLTGEGIQNALRSADLLVQAWMGGGVEAYPSLARGAFEAEFRLARLLRRSVFESEAGLGLIERAITSRRWHAVVTAVVNGVNEHDASVLGLALRWARSIRAARRVAGQPGEVRPSGFCGCGCTVAPVVAEVECRSAAAA